MTLQIDKGIPLPLSSHNKGYTATMKKMKVGDSVFLPTIHQAVYSLAKRMKQSGCFSCRLEVQASIKGVRVWRIKDAAPKTRK